MKTLDCRSNTTGMERTKYFGEAYDLWLVEIPNGYGDAKASMLQDFERGRTTEIDFINGYVVDTARQFGF
jgi:ketopantoate reductase